jgi:hypothetical protein
MKMQRTVIPYGPKFPDLSVNLENGQFREVVVALERFVILREHADLLSCPEFLTTVVGALDHGSFEDLLGVLNLAFGLFRSGQITSVSSDGGDWVRTVRKLVHETTPPLVQEGDQQLFDTEFVEGLVTAAGTHEVWLAIVQFGLPTLLQRPDFLIRLIAREALRSDSYDADKIASAVATIMFDELKLCLSAETIK